MDPWGQIEARLDRAYRDAYALTVLEREFFDSKPWTIRVERHMQAAADTVEFRAFFDTVGDIPIPMRMLISTSLFHLRSALDYVAWQLVVASGGKPTYKTAFPIRHTKVGPNGGPRTIQIHGGVDPDALRVVEMLQPYNRQDPTSDPLWVLNDLHRRDKHRFLALVTLVQRAQRVQFVYPTLRYGNEMSLTRFPEGVRLVPDRHLATLSVPRGRYVPEADVEVQADLLMDVTFDQGEPAAGERVSDVLKTLYDAVGEVARMFSVFVL